MAQAEIFRVSALSGAGIDPLRQRLLAMVEGTAAKRTDAPFRLPVDRAFGVKGFGLVCTGHGAGRGFGQGRPRRDRNRGSGGSRAPLTTARRDGTRGAGWRPRCDQFGRRGAGSNRTRAFAGRAWIFPLHADARRPSAAPRLKPHAHGTAHPRALALGYAGDYGAGRPSRCQALDARAGGFRAASSGGSRNCGVGRPLCAAPVLASTHYWRRPRAQSAPGQAPALRASVARAFAGVGQCRPARSLRVLAPLRGRPAQKPAGAGRRDGPRRGDVGALDRRARSRWPRRARGVGGTNAHFASGRVRAMGRTDQGRARAFSPRPAAQVGIASRGAAQFECALHPARIVRLRVVLLGGSRAGRAGRGRGADRVAQHLLHPGARGAEGGGRGAAQYREFRQLAYDGRASTIPRRPAATGSGYSPSAASTGDDSRIGGGAC